ncbi:MAG: intracellular protease/amidase [Spirulina sp. SIO3F2]|nr:intracellular protease/amidase [Spirulina sp. SIO3F2]
MDFRALAGKKVAILVETGYIYSEIEYYQTGFQVLGATVDCLSYLQGERSRTLISELDKLGEPTCTMKVDKDVADYDPNSYDIVLIASGYCASRLREIPPRGSLGSIEELQTPAAVQFYKQAMRNPNIIKGALGQGLWILTPCPEVLTGRRVICHTTTLADVYNAGAVYVPDESHIVVDGDLVTARSTEDLSAYFDAVVSLALSNY